MTYYRSGYRFLLDNVIPGFRTISVSQRTIALLNESYPILVYDPPGEAVATLITFSGFSVHGYRDRRLAKLSKAFARQGFRVITPGVPDIDRLWIHPTSIDKFADLIQAIYSDSVINPSKQAVSVFAASYSGGVAMLAACRQHIAPCINTICLLGTFADFRNVLRFVVEEDGADIYARYIILRNFLQRSKIYDRELVKLFDVAIHDSGFRRKTQQLPILLQSASLSNIQLFGNLLNNTDFRRTIVYGALKEIDRSEHWSQKFHLEDKLDHASFSVNLIHGQHDKVIPSSESVCLHESLLRRGRCSKLVLTNLLDHGDLTLNRNIWAEVNKLASGFGAFIKSSLNTEYYG